MKIPMKIPLLSEQRIQQFWAKVALTADDQKCWEWQAAKKGVTKLWSYGMFALNKRPYLAHRISYMLCVGVDPGEMCVLHKCDNPACVNPNHLFLGTPKDNVQDCQRKGRKFQPPALGVQNGYCKLSEQNVRDIRRQYANGGVTQSTLGIAFGVGQTVISSIVLRKRWSHI